MCIFLKKKERCSLFSEKPENSLTIDSLNKTNGIYIDNQIENAQKRRLEEEKNEEKSTESNNKIQKKKPKKADSESESASVSIQQKHKDKQMEIDKEKEADLLKKEKKLTKKPQLKL